MDDQQKVKAALERALQELDELEAQSGQRRNFYTVGSLGAGQLIVTHGLASLHFFKKNFQVLCAIRRPVTATSWALMRTNTRP